MEKERRAMVYDHDLRITAYRFEAMGEPFPSHFHEHYVLGLVERGQRRMICGGRAQDISRGDVVIFHPGESHACAQEDGGAFHYRGLHVPGEVMKTWCGELGGRTEAPAFARNVIRDEELACSLRALHEQVMEGEGSLAKEESMMILTAQLLRYSGALPEADGDGCTEAVARACAYMEEHTAQRISLDALCREAGLSKATLLRCFTREKGVTPYRYLEALRINGAKRLLEQGYSPAEAALETGFTDQSHLTHVFRRLLGVTPGIYQDTVLERGEPRQRSKR